MAASHGIRTSAQGRILGRLTDQAPHRKDEGDSQLGERLLFAGYTLVIVLGLVLFFVAGITHR